MARPTLIPDYLRKRVDITLNPEILNQAKIYASQRGESLSGLIEKLLLQEIAVKKERSHRSFPSTGDPEMDANNQRAIDDLHNQPEENSTSRPRIKSRKVAVHEATKK